MLAMAHLIRSNEVSRRLVLGGASALLAGAVAGGARAASSPVLVELFTSQGCSSCPPADAYLKELAREPGILALAYHVDYWDDLGWRDPFSSVAATARQRAYARLMALSSIYTPQMVVNGRFEAVGSDRDRVAAAIAKAAAIAPVAPVALTAADDTLITEIAAGTGEGRVWGVVYDLRHETDVRRGENAGRTLTNVNIVRSIDALGTWSGAALTISHDLPQPGSGAAVFVQASNGAILGAAAFNASV
jgi:hypothetical protein